MKTVREVIAGKMFQQEGTNEESMWDFLVYADDILTALKEAGYAVVPVEPTREMMEAGHEARAGWTEKYVHSIYAAMLKTASQDQGRG